MPSKSRWKTHADLRTKIQQILNEALDIADRYDLRGDYKILLGTSKEHQEVSITNTSIIGTKIGFIEVKIGDRRIRIQYQLLSRLVSDSTQWVDGIITKSGHIQTNYSHESPDPELKFNFIGILASITNWKVVTTEIKVN